MISCRNAKKKARKEEIYLIFVRYLEVFSRVCQSLCPCLISALQFPFSRRIIIKCHDANGMDGEGRGGIEYSIELEYFRIYEEWKVKVN